MMDDGVHSLQLDEGRSTVVCSSSPRLWKVLVSCSSGLTSQRARAAHHCPRRGTLSDNGDSEKNQDETTQLVPPDTLFRVKRGAQRTSAACCCPNHAEVKSDD